ncbi:MAG: acetylglutamate kinase [Verrucomicrobiota bacterium]|nr:acetylglutamate kinase [Verrucomicrobiota bacterium]
MNGLRSAAGPAGATGQMREVIKKAGVLIEALPYIQDLHGEIVVVKYGGSAMENKENAEGALTDVAFMECVGMQPIVVHGGGKAITRGMKESGLEAKFVKGLRVTCEKTIKIVERIIKDEVNPEIVRLLQEKGAPAQTINGEAILRVRKLVEVDPATGQTMDWGFVGEPDEVNTAPVRKLLKQGVIPVITPLGMGPDGKIHNVNADSSAAAVAKALRARKLVFLTDVSGLLRDRDDPESIITTLKAGDVEELAARGVIDGGMLPKVRGGLEALKFGVGKIHMVDGRMPHSLLLEIFTDKGVGTEIVSDEQK